MSVSRRWTSRLAFPFTLTRVDPIVYIEFNEHLKKCQTEWDEYAAQQKDILALFQESSFIHSDSIANETNTKSSSSYSSSSDSQIFPTFVMTKLTSPLFGLPIVSQSSQVSFYKRPWIVPNWNQIGATFPSLEDLLSPQCRYSIHDYLQALKTCHPIHRRSLIYQAMTTLAITEDETSFDLVNTIVNALMEENVSYSERLLSEFRETVGCATNGGYVPLKRVTLRSCLPYRLYYESLLQLNCYLAPLSSYHVHTLSISWCARMNRLAAVQFYIMSDYLGWEWLQKFKRKEVWKEAIRMAARNEDGPFVIKGLLWNKDEKVKEQGEEACLLGALEAAAFDQKYALLDSFETQIYSSLQPPPSHLLKTFISFFLDHPCLAPAILKDLVQRFHRLYLNDTSRAYLKRNITKGKWMLQARLLRERLKKYEKPVRLVIQTVVEWGAIEAVWIERKLNEMELAINENTKLNETVNILNPQQTRQAILPFLFLLHHFS